MKKKQRIDSITGQVEALIAGQREIKPPEYMEVSDTELLIFKGIVKSRYASSWNEFDLSMAVILAKLYAEISELFKIIDKEGYILKTPTGKKYIHPANKLIDNNLRTGISIMRLLQIHPAARLGRSCDTGKRTIRERELLDSMPDDDLLAKKPKVN